MSSQFTKRKLKNKLKDLEIIEEGSNMDGEAVDIYYDDELRKFIQVVIAYDLETGYTKIKSKEAIADSQPVAIHKIQKHFVDKILFLRR